MTVVYTWGGRDDASKVSRRTQPSARCSLFGAAREMECGSIFDIEMHGKTWQNRSLLSIIPYVFVFEIGSHCVCHHVQRCLFLEETFITSYNECCPECLLLENMG